MSHPPVGNLINGQWSSGDGLEHLDVTSPLDGSVLSSIPLSTTAELDRAVEAATAAFSDWASLTIRDRAQVAYRYRSLLESHTEELAELVHLENGKTVAEGRAEVAKAIEVTEFACSLPQLVAGEVLEVSSGVECRVDHCPLGVVASITPFNFPCMVPHWTIPIAITLGNAYILKPSEQVPLTARRSAELLAEAGLPDGVFQMINGDRRIVEAICDHPGISAVAFVGSTPVARSVYSRATSSGKRALGMGGAKNHLVVLPDADVELTAENVTESATGCAGQRCMAASALIAVGESDHIIERVCEKAAEVVPGRNLGAVISSSARDRIVGFIDEAEAAGARVLVDGRGATVEGCEGGYYVGATVIDGVTPEMAIAQQEVFGPVLAVLRAGDMDEALEIERRSPFGNAAAIYTRDGGAAREFASRASSGMIGVNIGVPVPREPFGFGGWNDSRFGVGNITGEESVAFWTQSRKVTSRWPEE